MGEGCDYVIRVGRGTTRSYETLVMELQTRRHHRHLPNRPTSATLMTGRRCKQDDIWPAKRTSQEYDHSGRCWTVVGSCIVSVGL